MFVTKENGNNTAINCKLLLKTGVYYNISKRMLVNIFQYIIVFVTLERKN